MVKALIVVDVQNDFAHPDGNLYVPFGHLVPERVNRFIPEYEHVIYTKDFHPPQTNHFEEHGGPWPTHCVGGTWGSEFHDDLLVVPQAPRVYKGTNPGEDGYSGFYVDNGDDTIPTPLEEILKQYEVTEVDIVGIALDVCVKATALDAHKLGYKTRVLVHATAPVTVDGGVQALTELQDAGVELTT